MAEPFASPSSALCWRVRLYLNQYLPCVISHETLQFSSINSEHQRFRFLAVHSSPDLFNFYADFHQERQTTILGTRDMSLHSLPFVVAARGRRRRRARRSRPPTPFFVRPRSSLSLASVASVRPFRPRRDLRSDSHRSSSRRNAPPVPSQRPTHASPFPMGNCCSTESTDPAAHALQPQAVPLTALTSTQQQQQQQPAASTSAIGANGSTEFRKPVGGDKPPPPQLLHAGVDVVKDPLVEPAPSSSSSSSGPLHQSPPRSASKKSVASGRTHEGPGPTHSLRIGSYNLRYAYYSKRGYYPEGTRLGREAGGLMVA